MFGIVVAAYCLSQRPLTSNAFKAPIVKLVRHKTDTPMEPVQYCLLRRFPLNNERKISTFMIYCWAVQSPRVTRRPVGGRLEATKNVAMARQKVKNQNDPLFCVNRAKTGTDPIRIPSRREMNITHAKAA